MSSKKFLNQRKSKLLLSQKKNVAPQKEKEAAATNKGLRRPIVIDGPNVAMLHGLQLKFSVQGIELVINHFIERGHDKVYAFLPEDKRNENVDLLTRLEMKGHVKFTPSRKAGFERIRSYDDRMMLDYAVKKGAIVVSKDNFKDLYQEEKYRETIRNRVLQPTFFGDEVLFPDDPLGRDGPNLDQFLKF